MPLIVKKFGGTSVGSPDHIVHVANKILQAKAAGHDIIVVLSAMGDETDRLLELAHKVTSYLPPRDYATLLSTGEQVSVALLSMALQFRGCFAKAYCGWQVGIRTNLSYQKARIIGIDTEKLKQDLAQGIVPIVAGFQGVNAHGAITTLGRGGSDTTAVALAAVMQADECQIYTDVDGVYTTDPRVVSLAKRLARITFEEMMEMASLGANVLQARAVECAGKYQVKLRVLSTFIEGPGTLICYEDKTMEDPQITGIAFNRSEAKLTVLGIPDRPGVSSALLNLISREGIGIDMVIQNISKQGRTDFTFTVHREDYNKAFQLLKQALPDLEAINLVGDVDIVKLSLVGVGMRSHAGVAAKMFEVLGHEGINIQMISTSEIKVSVVIAEKYLELGVRALHTAFGLDHQLREEMDPYLTQNIKLPS